MVSNQRRRLLPAFAVLLASAAAVASVHGSPSSVAPKASLNQVPGIRRRAFQDSKGGMAGESSHGQTREDPDATMLRLEEKAVSDESNASPVQIKEPGRWPCMDDLDRKLIQISLPVIANFAIAPVIGAADLFFVNRLGNALAVAGQAAANQVYGSVFFLTSFIPSSKYSH